MVEHVFLLQDKRCATSEQKRRLCVRDATDFEIFVLLLDIVVDEEDQACENGKREEHRR